MSITCITIFLALISFVITASINGSVSKTDLKEGDNVDITAAVILSENERFTSLSFIFGSNVIATGAKSSFTLQPYAIAIFRDRISGNVSGFNYKLSINNLHINDSMILRIYLYYVKTYWTFQVDAQVNTTISITVNADPTILSFPELLFIKEGKTLAFETTVYGKPKPVCIIKLPERLYNAKSSTETQSNTYKFVYDLGKITANDCGMVLQLNVSGNGKVVNRSSTVIVQFIPPMVKELSVVQFWDFSVIIKWKPITFGKCYVLYNVEFLNSSNQVVHRNIGINGTEISTTNSANATNVKLYATFFGTIGESFILRITFPHITKTKGFGLAPKNSLFDVGAAVGAAATGAAVTLVALVTYCIVFFRRRTASKLETKLELETKIDRYNHESCDYQEMDPVQKENYASYLTEDYEVLEIQKNR